MIAQIDAQLDRHRLRTLVERAAAAARRDQRPALVATAIALPDDFDVLAWFADAARDVNDAVLFDRPENGGTIAGIGAAATIERTAHAAYGEVGSEAIRALAAVALDDDAARRPRLAFVGGFRFDDRAQRGAEWHAYPSGRLVLPEITVHREHGQTTLTLLTRIAADDAIDAVLAAIVERVGHVAAPEQPAEPAAPDVATDTLAPADFATIVDDATARIQRGELAKVVLARRRRLEMRTPLAPLALLATLRAKNAQAFVFAFVREGAAFIGATPERLVTLAGGRYDVDALAGTVARGATREEDEQLGTALFANAKERHEHALVVDGLRAALAPISASLADSGAPRLRALRTLQHLYTPLWGTIAPGYHVLDIVERLHPSPAVGGAPRAAALDVIAQSEGFDRGWYAGPIGWIDAAGEGEFVVALRSALVRANDAFLYAGVGIVGDSQAAREIAEVDLKLTTMRDAFGLAR